MQSFYCTCGKEVFFENIQCLECKRVLGFDSDSLSMKSFLWSESGHLISTENIYYKYCKNYYDFDVCNWLLKSDNPNHYCVSCELNQLIPEVTVPEKRYWWFKLEESKRRLVYTLLKLKLPIISKQRSANGLAFAFLEDRRMNPAIHREIVNTGHAQGLITIYLAEADDIARERTRIEMGEDYRTLLGHFRHESGHYYFDQLVKHSQDYADFKKLFGDEEIDYPKSLQMYYDKLSSQTLSSEFISDYAQAHPHEDWAECWAHYFHIVDTLETAFSLGLVTNDPFVSDIDAWLEDWPRVTIVVNRLNKSLGLKDAYPFNLSESSIKKLHFVHRVIASHPKC